MKKVRITNGVKFRTVTEKNLNRILAHPQTKENGWRLVSGTHQSAAPAEKKVFEAPKVEEKPKTEAAPQKAEAPVAPKETPKTETLPSRDNMIKELKSKGINVHWNLSDAKLSELYESEFKSA